MIVERSSTVVQLLVSSFVRASSSSGRTVESASVRLGWVVPIFFVLHKHTNRPLAQLARS